MNRYFFKEPVDVSNLISGSSAFSKFRLTIWKFIVHILLKPGLVNFEHFFTTLWDECNCVVVWVFFGIAFLWHWNENWHFAVLSVATAEFSKFAGILSITLPQHHLLGFERAQLEFRHLHLVVKIFFVQFFCVFLPPLLNIFCFC